MSARESRSGFRARASAPAFLVLQDPPRPSLDTLVARTQGPQWWRKVFHAASAALIATAIAFLDWPDRTLLLALGGAVALLLAADFVRLSSPGANALFFRAFGRLASPREAKGIASSTWYAMGILIVVAVFPRPEAIAAILVLGLGDPAAAFVGRTVGKRPFMGGTLEGSAAFFGTSAALMLLLFDFAWQAVLVAALAATLAERRSWPFDDNLAVPLACAGALVAMGWLLG